MKIPRYLGNLFPSFPHPFIFLYSITTTHNHTTDLQPGQGKYWRKRDQLIHQTPQHLYQCLTHSQCSRNIMLWGFIYIFYCKYYK